MPINNFMPISLSEMDSVKLMDRVDQKFLIPIDLLEAILTELQPYYRILEINDQRLCVYETLYYDTVDLQLYHAHQSKRLNRYKVRYRNYVASKLAFFEIKHKTNKGRTKKTRIRQESEENNERNGVFLNSSTPLIYNDLKEIMWVNYSRMTLVSKTTHERLTIDLDLTFKNDLKEVNYRKFVIAEVKQERIGTSIFTDLMRKFDLREGSISKYCLGIISLYKNVKHNNFKAKLRKIKALEK